LSREQWLRGQLAPPPAAIASASNICHHDGDHRGRSASGGSVYRVRRLLAAMTERDLQDMGSCCWSKIADEINKPFWLK
jgi:hypothetical protein